MKIEQLSHKIQPPITSLIIGEGNMNPQTLSSLSLPDETINSLCYPEGNFEGNQLLDVSISLSLPYSDQTIDLHVRAVADFHRGFPGLYPVRT